MTRYDRYFFRVFLQSLAVVGALFVTIFLVVDALLNLDELQRFDDPLRGISGYYAFNLPPLLYLVYPLMVLAAGMFSLSRILRARELLILESAGVGPGRALLALLLPALLLGGIGLYVRDQALPQLAREARESPYGAYEFRKGKRITVRDEEGNAWFVRRYDLNEGSLEGVRILTPGGDRLAVCERMRWNRDSLRWDVEGEGTVWNLASLAGDAGIGGDSRAFAGSPPFGRLLPADLARRRRGFSDRTLRELSNQVALRPDYRELGTALWHELWHPFGGAILFLCGAGLLLGRGRGKPALAGALALLCVLGYAVLGFLFETLGTSGFWSPAIGASVAPAAFLLLGIGLWVRR